VGGDYFDVIELAANRTLLVVADVSGKGMPAALLASNIQALVRSMADNQPDLSSLANRPHKSAFEPLYSRRSLCDGHVHYPEPGIGRTNLHKCWPQFPDHLRLRTDEIPGSCSRRPGRQPLQRFLKVQPPCAVEQVLAVGKLVHFTISLPDPDDIRQADAV